MRTPFEPEKRRKRGVAYVGWAVILTAVGACNESQTEPTRPAVETKSSIASVSTTWTTTSGTLSVSNETVDERTGDVVGDRIRYRFAVNERKEGDGWRATFLKHPHQSGELPAGMARRPSGRNLARVEVDTKGTSRAFSVDGSVFPRNRAALSALRNNGAKAPSWFSPPPRLSTTPSFSRRSLIADLIVDPTEGTNVESALTKRFGAAEPNGDGDKRFSAVLRDTTRVIVYRPQIGSIVSIETTAHGRLVSRTEYSFEERGGQTVRTQIRSFRVAPARTGPHRLLRTTLAWSDVKIS
jgi:hypothetical protein